GSEPAEIFSSLRHGALSGPPVRLNRYGNDRCRKKRFSAAGGLLSVAAANQAYSTGRNRCDASIRNSSKGGCTRMSHTADVIVIGAGIHGCSTALHLAMRGLKPVVIEKDHAGRHASGVNAGGVRQLARHFAEVPLSVASMELWERIEDLVGDDCGFTSEGQVLVAETEAE